MAISNGERVISRALRLMQAGKARSWSHAIQLAAESTEKEEVQTKGKKQ